MRSTGIDGQDPAEHHPDAQTNEEPIDLPTEAGWGINGRHSNYTSFPRSSVGTQLGDAPASPAHLYNFDAG